MTASKNAVLSLVRKIIELTEEEMKDGKHEGRENEVRKILDAARAITSDNTD